MPVDTTTTTVGDVVDELDERLDEIAHEADATDELEERQALDQQGVALDQRLAAFEELQEEHGAGAQFAIAELTVDERMRFGDLLEAAQDQAQQRQGYEAGSNMRDIFWTGAGVVDAPWLDGGESMHERVAALRSDSIDVDWRVVQYLKERVTEANAKGNPERRSYAQRREETRATSQNEGN